MVRSIEAHTLKPKGKFDGWYIKFYFVADGSMNSPWGERFLQGRSSCRVSSRMDVMALKVLDQVQERFKVTRTDFFKAVLVATGNDLVERSDSAIARKFFKAANILGPIEEMPASAR